MIRIELRIEYEAQEITVADFDGVQPNFSRVKGVIYRNETRTARLASEEELDDLETEGRNEALDASESYQSHRPKRPSYEPRGKGVQPPGKFSFYGIGCFIILKNGKPFDIMPPEKLREVYKLA